MAKFYICRACGNIVNMIHDSGAPLNCCGQNMQPLVPNTVDASGEKHLPVVNIEGDTVNVKVGVVAHPMLPEHYIEWIYVQTANGGQYKALKPGDEPRACFTLCGDKVVAVYAYCNIHGLWMTKL